MSLEKIGAYTGLFAATAFLGYGVYNGITRPQKEFEEQGRLISALEAGHSEIFKDGKTDGSEASALEGELDKLTLYVATLMHPAFDKDFPELTQKRIDFCKSAISLKERLRAPQSAQNPASVGETRREMRNLMEGYREIVTLRWRPNCRYVR